MFTGIIEEIGLIEGIKKGEKSSKLVIKANIVLNDIHIGDSISTNGVCLTVTNIYENKFVTDVILVIWRESNVT